MNITGDLPTILMELNANDGSIRKSYIYANSQIIAQHDGSYTTNKYFYLHDRLDSVRQIINTSGDVVKYYTYEPFGEILETQEQSTNLKNYFLFTGQFFDFKNDEYCL